MEITYEILKPIIKAERVNGNQVTVDFQGPGHTSPVQGLGMVVPDQNAIMKNVGKQAVKTGVISAAIRAVSRLLGGLIGGSAGSIASSATSQVGYAVASGANSTADYTKVDMTPEKQQEAVLMAFKQVSTSFEWNPEMKEWRGKTAEEIGAAYKNA